MNNVIEINAEEDYINRDTDDIKNEMKNGLIFQPVDPCINCGIDGETFIKPKLEETYSVNEAGGKWKILENVPVHICQGEKIAKVTWNKTTSGQFTLQWSKGTDIREKTIVVESLY